MFDLSYLKFKHSFYLIYANIIKFKSFLKTFINKLSHDKRSDILFKFLNKKSSQI